MKRARILATVLLWTFVAGEGLAQDTAQTELSRWILPGSDEENYVRALQTLGMVPRYPWSARSFSSRELRLLTPDSTTPQWKGWPTLRRRALERGGLRIDVAPIEGRSWYNSAMPHGSNDGAVWVGRGLTLAGSAGVSASWGPVEVTLAPEVFWAENRAFTLDPTGDPLRPYADPLWPTDVDRPQRFGDGSYSRVDAGRSGIRLDFGGVAAGVTNAHESWGPMTEFPLIMGTNAPGFPHAFAGTSRPVNIWIGRVHGRVIYARLEQSEFSPVTTMNPRRFASGMVAVFEPRFIQGLEVGASRFFHVVWPDSGLESRYFAHIFQSFLKQRVGRVFAPFPSDPNSSTDNQLASVFARWVVPGSGFEVYGEFGREDHSTDVRDLVLEPEHNGAFAIGARKSWSGQALWLVQVELVNFESGILGRSRGQFAWYRHSFTEQGHTHIGQLLASAIGVGSGSGSTVTVRRISHDNMVAARWSRLLVGDAFPPARGTKVQQVLGLEHRFTTSKRLEVRTESIGVYELAGPQHRSRTNVRLRLGLILRP